MGNSILEERLEFSDNGKIFMITPLGFMCNFRFYDYCFQIKYRGEIWEIVFDQYRGIVDCKHYKEDGTYKTLKISEFKKKFQKTIKKTITKNLYVDYLSAIDMGIEGVLIRGR
jgi:hypothetical protein